MQIMNNILAEIVKTCDMDTKTYNDWLRLEVGISEEEMSILKSNGCLPLPEEVL